MKDKMKIIKSQMLLKCDHFFQRGENWSHFSDN